MGIEINILKKSNKKGILFTILAMTLLSLFLISYGFYSLSQNRESINKRVDTMNNFVSLVEEDLPRQLYISGFRIIFLFEKEIVEEGEYINNLNASFQEAFYNGTINGRSDPIMEGVTFSGILNSLNNKASKVNVEINLFSPNITISQDSPWKVKISFMGELLIKDKENLARWNKNYSKDVYILIEHFEDPLYVINTNGLVINKINKTKIDDFVQGEDATNLLRHAENSFYINSTLAPGFLERLEGKTSSSENGIESLVYLPKLSQQGIPVKRKTVVDYIYFSSNTPESYNVQNMPDWFRLDDAHLDSYESRDLVIMSSALP